MFCAFWVIVPGQIGYRTINSSPRSSIATEGVKSLAPSTIASFDSLPVSFRLSARGSYLNVAQVSHCAVAKARTFKSRHRGQRWAAEYRDTFRRDTQLATTVSPVPSYCYDEN